VTAPCEGVVLFSYSPEDTAQGLRGLLQDQLASLDLDEIQVIRNERVNRERIVFEPL